MTSQLDETHKPTSLPRRLVFLLFMVSSIVAIIVGGSPHLALGKASVSTAIVNELYWTESKTGQIRRGSPGGSTQPVTVVSGQNNPRGLVLDTSHQRMYWLERGADRLRSANLNGSDVTTLRSDLSKPERMAIDEGAGHLYWTENGTSNRIARVNLDGSNESTLLSGLGGPVGIALDVANNAVYWVEFDTDSIWRATMQGTNAVKLVQQASGTRPLDLALDLVHNKMYWGSGVTGDIYRANLDGSNVEFWGDFEEVRALTVDPDGGKVYWATHANQQIRRANLDKSAIETIYGKSDGIDAPMGLVLYANPVEPPCYTLTLTSSPTNGGMINPSPMPNCAGGKYVYDTQVSLTVTTNSGFVFVNWSGDVSGTNLPKNLRMTADKTAIANFSESVVCYTLVRDSEGGGNDPVADPLSSSGCEPGHYTAGQQITLTATPSPGWRVANWSGTNNNSSTSTTNSVTMPAANHVVVVTYEEVPPTCYRLTRDRTGEGAYPTATPSNSSGCNYDHFTAGEQITLIAAPSSGWRVTGWSGTDNDSNATTTNVATMPAADRTIVAIYEPVPALCYALSRIHSGDGSDPDALPINSAGCAFNTYKAGEQITLTATPAPGWRVTGWSGTDNDGSTSTTNLVTMPAADRTVSVTYALAGPTCYTLTLSFTGSGAQPVASPPNSSGCAPGKFVAGEQIELTAIPAAGWAIEGWTGTNNNNSVAAINSLTMPAAAHEAKVHYKIAAPTFYFGYLPHIMFQRPQPCFSGSDEREPNNTPEEASTNGPVCFSGSYRGLPNDLYDIYEVKTHQLGRIAIALTNFIDEAQLALYDNVLDETPMAIDTDTADGLAIQINSAEAGRYFVVVINPKSDGSITQRYQLDVSLP